MYPVGLAHDMHRRAVLGRVCQQHRSTAHPGLRQLLGFCTGCRQRRNASTAVHLHIGIRDGRFRRCRQGVAGQWWGFRVLPAHSGRCPAVLHRGGCYGICRVCAGQWPSLQQLSGLPRRATGAPLHSVFRVSWLLLCQRHGQRPVVGGCGVRSCRIFDRLLGRSGDSSDCQRQCNTGRVARRLVLRVCGRQPQRSSHCSCGLPCWLMAHLAGNLCGRRRTAEPWCAHHHPC
mmetsp:Transcript_3000/g.7142  ORF Transcript_3000/g.7142 Transcript_3000/m.7142 type:complete len:231 (+) Transcript_3000:881-1573(+)